MVEKMTHDEHGCRLKMRGIIMMKSYYTGDRLQIVGKAWEIRYQTRQWLKEAPPTCSVSHFLQARAGNQQPPVLLHKQTGKKKDRPVLPFPSS